ncbi:MAG: YdiU family protein, partial [Gluconacetobacter diazotrophicus]|nr:YdiU family protein [Gluconacetobacter diazotrophicus]
FDYGPWRFLPTYQPDFTAAYFDTGRLYAFGRQPDTLVWNLVRLAEALLSMAEAEQLEPVLHRFGDRFHAALSAAMLRRLGRAPSSEEADAALTRQVWQALRETQVPFERFFFDGYAAVPDAGAYPGEAFDQLRRLLRDHPVAPGATRDHPYFADPAPCTMLIDEVEALWAPIAERDDWSAFESKLDAIRRMAAAISPPR